MILDFIMRNGNRKPSNIFILGNVILPIVLGGFIYVAWRKDTLLIFSWFQYLGLGSAVFRLRVLLAPFYEHIPKFILFCLAVGLWVYSLTFFMGWLWNSSSKLAFIFWVSIASVLGAGGELAQSFDIVQGYFDFSDLLACILAVSLAIYLTQTDRFHAVRSFSRRRSTKNNYDSR